MAAGNDDRRFPVRTNAGRPPSRLGFSRAPAERLDRRDADEDADDRPIHASSRAFDRPTSYSYFSSTMASDVSRASHHSSIHQEISRLDDEYFDSVRMDEARRAEREERRAEREERRAERMQTLEREQYERRRALLLSTSARTGFPAAARVLASTPEAPSRGHARSPVIPATRANVHNFIQNYHDAHEIQPLIDDLNNYEDFHRRSPDIPLDVPLMASTPTPAAAVAASSGVGLAAAINEGFREGFQEVKQLFPSLAAPSSATVASAEFMRRQKSMIALISFDGKPEKWLAFINHYRTTNAICGFQNFENLKRLQDCLTGDARSAVEAILNLPENVDKVISTLESLFGTSQRIILNLISKAKATPAPRSGRPETIVVFANEVRNMVTTMLSLNCTGDLANPQLLRELAMRLPNFLQEQWCEVSVLRPSADLLVFSEWLDSKSKAASLQTLLRPDPVNFADQKDRPVDRRGDKRGHQGGVFHGREKKPRDEGSVRKCDICSEEHWVGKCPKLLDLDIEGRWNLVTTKKLCFCCLRSGHLNFECQHKNACKVDGCLRRNHHTLLHRQTTTAATGAMLHVTSSTPQVLLRIVPIKLFGPRGEVSTYALLDEGSTLSLMENKLAIQLGLTGRSEPLCMQWTHDVVHHDQSSRKVALGISGTFSGAKVFTMTNVRTVDDMQLPSQSIDMSQLVARWPYLRNVPFESFHNVRPKMIIGQNNYLLTAPRRIIHSTWTAPVASKTWLGWVIHGMKPASGDAETPFNFHLCEQPSMDLSLLHLMVKESFTIENFGVKLTNPTGASRQDMRAVQLLEATTVRVNTRWQTGLLWRSDSVLTPDSKPLALRRLKCLEAKMDRDATYAEGYCAKMQDLLDKGYVRKLTPDELTIRSPREWYFPHFGVVNPNKPGKVRIVFDAAAKSRGMSFNDYMITGPDLLLSIVAVLWRFRTFKFAFASDIKEMFLRILIPETEINSQRFFWRGMARNFTPDVYAVVVVCFGGTSSPCSANYVKIRNAEEFKDEFPTAYKMVLKQSYMDDYMGGGDTVEEATQVIHDLIEVHRRGGFELCNWTCNSKDILGAIPADLLAAGVKNLSPDSEIPVERVLGMWWNPEQDYFTYRLNFHKVPEEVKGGAAIPTKRQMLQLVMSIYDPLGFLAFFTIRARILLQEIWKISLGWDDPISGVYAVCWKKWVTDLQNITAVRIPRCYSHKLSRAGSTQLHLFCDASEQAYAAVAYLRIIPIDGAVEVVLVGAKTRVSPIKQLSIPQLELQAALLATRLALSIKTELDLSFNYTWFWSDSMTVLGWLRNEIRRLRQYVANRVGEILESTDLKQWRWIQTKENVADDATRNSNHLSFSDDNRWFSGPSFLKLLESEWPQDVNTLKPSNDDPEYVGVISTKNGYLPDIARFSSYLKLVRSTAWIVRFIAKCQKKSQLQNFPKSLTPEEIEEAELLWYKKVQNDSFSSEITTLRKKRSVEKSSTLFQLSPCLNEKELLVLKGRIDNAEDLDISQKRPTILDPTHQFTKLLVRHYHTKMGHQGQETVINEIRQRFWVLRIRSAIQDCVRKCQLCKNNKTRPLVPEMGDLPKFRFFKKVRPFTFCGLDYFGPLLIKNKRCKEKRYGVLFTCMSTRAIHLELAGSLTTDSAINAIRRFIGRRGQPLQIISDNATNFQGAAAELKTKVTDLDRPIMMEATTSKGIKWSFNPPASPHMGGSWERLIRSVKTALHSSLKETIPNEETLQTFLVEVEHIINSRPLTHVSVDPKDPESLTPNHFLLGNSSGAPSPGSFEDSEINFKKQWKYTQLLTDRFWQRWVKEYLPTLAKRTKWFKPAPPLIVGDVVIIADPNGPRNSWPLGRIINVFPGKDGQVRVVDVKTQAGTFRRPVAKLCKLDLEAGSDKDETSSPYGG